MKMKPYSDYILGLLIAIAIFLIGISIHKIVSNYETTNYYSETEFENKLLEYKTGFDKIKAAEEKISRQAFEDLEQENANLKMTVTTFESLILTLDADNQKLSEIIEKQNRRVGGWPLFFLLTLISGLSVGMVIVVQQLRLLHYPQI